MITGAIVGLIEMRNAPAFYNAINERIIDHVLVCKVCRPGVRCTQYVSLTEIRNSLSFVERRNDNAQKN